MDTSDYRLIAEEINNYLLTGNALTAVNDIHIDYEKNTDERFASYTYKMTVSYKDSASYRVQYVSYYNESKEGAETEIEGVLLLDGTEHRLEGKKETDNDEVEMEMKVYLDSASYISVSNETQTSENEYKYEYWQNGEIVKSVSMSTSVENGIKQTEVEIVQGGVTVAYEFEYKDTLIECEYMNGTKTAEVIIHVHSDHYLYEFEDGPSIELKKNFR